MSLGGYKFAGYKCNKGSLSDTAFCLLMHKTRLKAFTEACSKSGANWHFCKNSGTIDFEGNTGVIYDLDGSGRNFASFFQYETDNKYIAILSLPSAGSVSAIASNWNGAIGACYGIYSQNNVRYAWTYASMFHVASMSDIDTNFLTGGTYPTNSLGMIPITHFYLDTSTGLSGLIRQGNFYYEGYENNRPLYFGYAVKGSKVISLCSIDKDGTYLTNGYIFPSIIGFDAMTLSSQSDQYNLFHANLSGVASDWKEYIYVKKNGWHVNNMIQILTSDGSRYTNSSYASSVMFNTTSLANFVYGVSTDIPFSAMRIVTNEISSWELRTSGALLNSDGIASKGLIDIDFMACNCTDGYANLKACGAYANGNYLLACKDYGGYQQYYVGWDPSNPDITLESSWEEYVEPVPAYTEKTLYLVSETQNFQTGVTNSFTGTKTPVYQLYEDSNLTTPSTYESNKSYETGRYVDNAWVPWTKLSDFPASTTSDFSSRVSSRLAVDSSGNLCLWFPTNYTSPLTATATQIIVRVYNS